MNIPLPLALAFTALTCGCTTSYTRTNAVRNTTTVLSRDASAYVAAPADGRYEQINYAGSGQQTATEVSAAFSRYLKRMELAPAVAEFPVSLSAARAGAFDYLVWPEIVHWEDRATEWSGKRDRIEIKIQVVDAKTGATIDATTVKGVGTWWTLGGFKPEKMLTIPINEHVDSLFGVQTPKPPRPRNRSIER